MSDAVIKLADKLDAEGQRTAAFFESLPAEVWDQIIYSDEGPWTAREILVHIVQTEAYLRRLMAAIKSGQAGLEQDFDLDSFNRAKIVEMKARGKQELLALFQARRRETISWLRSSLTAGDLARRGLHPGVGETSLENMARLIYLHIQAHQRDIRRGMRTDQHA